MERLPFNIPHVLWSLFRFHMTRSWTLTDALPGLIATVVALVYSLYLLSNPPRHRTLSVMLLAYPMTYAFTQQAHIAPNWMVCDTFGRFLYIWFFNMSYEISILGFSPQVAKENDGWKSRVKGAYRVLFSRSHAQQVLTAEGKKVEQKRVASHGYSRWHFVAHHVGKAVLLYLAMTVWTTYEDFGSRTKPFHYSAEKAYFFRRLPDSLALQELVFRLELTFDWCVVSMWMYESYHSLFAILFVGILRFDRPEEWSMSLFGGFAEAWSVRRYWGKHWHNFIYNSFSGHAKVVTRGWLGMKRGSIFTRILENTLVFLASGLMHSLVRWQQDPDGEPWCISIWYIAQMLPIIFEGVIQAIWAKLRMRLGVAPDNRFANIFELTVGHAWVCGWFLWTIPKYIHTRGAWTDELLMKKYAVPWESLDAGSVNKTD